MRRFLLALPSLLASLFLLPALAMAQGTPIPPPVSPNGFFINLNTSGIVSNNLTVTHDNTNPTDNQIHCTDNINAGSWTGAFVCQYITLTLAGTGNLVNGGHAVAAKPLIFDTLTAGTVDHLNASQMTYQMVYGGHTVSTLNFNIAYIQGLAAGGTVTQANMNNCNQPNPGAFAGTIGTWACLYQPAIFPLTGGGTITNTYLIENLEPAAQTFSEGQTINSTLRELGPTMSPGVATGRYYYGVSPAAGTQTFANALTNIWMAPFYVPERTTYTHLGFAVTTGQAGGLCQAGIYAPRNSEPVGAPLVTTASLDASTAENSEATISKQLDAGFYLLAVQCNNNAITLTMYLEGRAQQIFGASSPTGQDTTPYAPNGTFGNWPSSPTLSYNNKANNMPLIWLRK